VLRERLLGRVQSRRAGMASWSVGRPGAPGLGTAAASCPSVFGPAGLILLTTRPTPARRGSPARDGRGGKGVVSADPGAPGPRASSAGLRTPILALTLPLITRYAARSRLLNNPG